ncbi:MAG: hypothetical protein HN909_07230, partial [Phycisphaerales bacterium]|nr:hypothetical protein [Phycisphaerales bacterium]
WDKWTAIVKKHAKGKDRFNYSKALQWKWPREQGGSYSLHGKLEALDAAEEWYYDAKTGMLYLYCPKGDTPANHVVEVKKRTYGVDAETCDFVQLKGIHFRATTFTFRECHHCLVDGCHIRFPNVAPLLWDLNMPSKPMVATQMIGHHNTVRNSSLAYSPTFGLRMLGSHNRVENNLIYDVNWVGSLCYANVWMGSLEDNYTWEGCLKYEGLLKETVPQATAEELANVQWGGKMGRIVKVHDPDRAKPAGNCVVRRNTLFGSGNIVLGFFEQPNYDIGYNYVYDGGMFVHDVSMIYTTLPQIRGSVVHHNWVTTKYKLCIRADDQSRGVAVHHNVMWGASTGSLVVKGDDNAVYHNTSLARSLKNWDLNVKTMAEPDKPHYRKLWPLLKAQNTKTPIWNNFVHRITTANGDTLYAKGDPRLSHNLIDANPASLLVNPAGLDFRPKPGSPLIDAGRVIKGVNDGFAGKAPDVGAYEFGVKPWVAGHKNFVRTHGETTDPETGESTMTLCLSMPAVKNVSVTLVPAEGVTLTSRSKLVFTAANWAAGRTVRFKVSKESSAKAITFVIEQPR